MRALVAGVESYEAGSAWDLDGPVRDALGYVRWLRELGVAERDMTLLLSPLARNRALADTAGLPHRPADRDTVHRVLARELADERSDWLLVAWSGHGLIDADRNRRLLFADAVQRDLRCLDVEAALALYRSDGAPGHPRQLWLLDACQTYADTTATAGALRPDPLPRATPRQQADQYVLFACGPGETTRNGMRSGVFSTEALRLLRDHPDWRTSPRPLAEALRGTFGNTTSLWFEGDGEAHRTVGHRPTVPAPRRATPGRRLELADKRRLHDALAAVDVMRRPESRGQIIGLLPDAMAGSVPRQAQTRLEILGLIDTCVTFSDGLTPLWEAVSLVDPGTPAAEALLEVLRDYPEWFTDPGANGG
ncbi:effector-associated domain 2-containing protein [Streptomyces sp. CB03234]|uniref:effector-associated domain 2-containing protein n=1 Tax=Streptomyces sp. (strain CB03234) TaxID=1703937 RepID=UPI0009390FAA|nr:caspase family protein [Streptomyces sp. CB03234]